MSTLQEVGDRDGWRCWLCDEPVDPDMGVNDPRGLSVDAVTSARPKKGAPIPEQFAHRVCPTRKGAVQAAVPWPSHLFVVDPARILETDKRPLRKSGRRNGTRRHKSGQIGVRIGRIVRELKPQINPDNFPTTSRAVPAN